MISGLNIVKICEGERNVIVSTVIVFISAPCIKMRCMLPGGKMLGLAVSSIYTLFYMPQTFAVAADSVLQEVQGSALPSYETPVCVVDCCNRFAECFLSLLSTF